MFEFDLISYFSLKISSDDKGGSGWENTIEIREVTIIDTSAAKVEYVENGVVTGTVSGLATGATYTPDRMPTTETPAGKYFAGWADKNGNIVDSGTATAPLGITLEYGNNTLTAVYKDYEQSYLLNPGVNKPTYYAYMDSTSRYTATLGVTYDQSAALQTDGSMFIYNNNQEWGATSIVPISANDSAALYAESNSTYKITVEYKATVVDVEALYQSSIANVTVGYPETNATVSITAGIGKSTSATSNRSFIASSPSTITHTENTDWLTQEFTVTTGNSVGAFPIFGLKIASGALPHNPGYNEDGSRKGSGWSGTKNYGTNGIYVKSVKIEKVVANVQYIVGDTVESTVENLVVGSAYTPADLPKTAAPEGKYFAGWKDAQGNYVLDTIILENGDNKLYASYVDFPSDINVDLSTNALKTVGNKKVVAVPSIASPDYDTPAYQGYMPYAGNGSIEYVTEGTESFERHSGSTSHAVLMHDQNGVAIQAKTSTTYAVTMTYRVSGNASAITSGKPNFYMYMNVGFEPISSEWLYTAENPNGGNYPFATRDNFKSVTGISGTQFKMLPESINQWHDHGPCLPFYAGTDSEWKTQTFIITTPADFGSRYDTARVPVFNYYVAMCAASDLGTCQLDIKSINIKESIHDDLQDATIAEKAVGYVKVLDEVEDNATYKVTFNGHLAVNNSGWSSVYALTANADNVNLNQSLIYGYNADHGVYGTMGSFGHDWVQTYTSFITTDLVAEEGNALYLYVTNPDLLASLNLISVEKVEGVKNGGVSMLAGAKETDKQALRYYFNYTTVNGNDIVIDGETYTIASRGFLLADADKVGDKTVTRTTAAEKDSGIIDANTTELTKCWGYTDNGDGTAKLEFSTYITGFKPDEGTYNNTNKLYVKGYVVLTNGSVIYSEESKMTVADVANLINAGGGRVH